MSNMLIALQITALGMGLVFAAIILLWGMMSLLTAITADKKPVSDSTTPRSEPAAVSDGDLRAAAAAVAVAVAIAEEQASMVQFLEPPTTIVSAWQLGMRTRQMYQKGNSIRRRAKQDDK